MENTSGSFRFFFGKHVRAQQLEKHQAGRRDSICSPLRNSLGRYFAKPRHLIGSAQRIYDLIRVHDPLKHALNDCVKDALEHFGDPYQLNLKHA